MVLLDLANTINGKESVVTWYIMDRAQQNTNLNITKRRTACIETKKADERGTWCWKCVV